ncbi:hypothetical protein MUN77_01585 [Leucobacter allii]|uniref:hypothetical protein n=1 Tax=Leucobacter allii TaxID=2932247 RepID=UPI001FD0586D|nr:hypothetical protein [Leucobacter allii]UOR02051.1 hypothetical protein MUN77_01585 [Leucobacter allii]
MTEEQLAVLFGDATLAQAVIWLAAASALVGVAVKFRWWERLKRFIATVDALAVLPQKLKLLDEIHHEVRPNTGTSLNDAVRRIESKTKALELQVAEQSGKIDGLQVLMESADEELADRVGDLEDTLNPKENP